MEKAIFMVFQVSRPDTKLTRQESSMIHLVSSIVTLAVDIYFCFNSLDFEDINGHNIQN